MGLREDYLQKPSLIRAQLLNFFAQEDKLIIFDVGSCDGLDSVKYASCFPGSTVYSFEPILANYEMIKANLADLGITNVKPYRLALSDKIGEVDIHKSSAELTESPDDPNWNVGNKSSSMLAPKEVLNIYQWCKFSESETVPVDTLRSFCQDNQIEEISFMHLDVQGAELMVIDGAGDFLKNIHLIWMEVSYVELYADQPLRNQTLEFMEEHGFILIKEDDRVIQGDHLYINEVFLSTQRGYWASKMFWFKAFFIKFSLARMLKNLYRNLVLIKINRK